MNKKRPCGLVLFGALILLFIINYILIIGNIYLQVSWLDKPMHFLGGFFTGLIGIYFLSFFLSAKQNMPIALALIVSLVTALAVGCLWEIVEFNSETIFQLKLSEIFTSKDTQSDLFFDFMGAIIGVLYFILLKDRAGRKSSPLLDKK